LGHVQHTCHKKKGEALNNKKALAERCLKKKRRVQKLRRLRRGTSSIRGGVSSWPLKGLELLLEKAQRGESLDDLRGEVEQQLLPRRRWNALDGMQRTNEKNRGTPPRWQVKAKKQESPRESVDY